MVKKGKKIGFAAGTLFGMALCAIILGTVSYAAAAAAGPETGVLGYPVYMNGKPITLNEAIMKDGRTYVQLREFCEQVGITVDWVDPSYHEMPIPGGRLPEGINLTNPTFVYTDTLSYHLDTSQIIDSAEITWMYKKYREGNDLKYAFGDSEFVVKSDGGEKTMPLQINARNGRIYIPIDEFREKVQPYLIDICRQG
jgi:hypothetical protein